MHSALKPFWGALLVGLSVFPLPAIADTADHASQRLEMVRTIEQYARYTSDIIGEDGLSPRVMDSMRTCLPGPGDGVHQEETEDRQGSQSK